MQSEEVQADVTSAFIARVNGARMWNTNTAAGHARPGRGGGLFGHGQRLLEAAGCAQPDLLRGDP